VGRKSECAHDANSVDTVEPGVFAFLDLFQNELVEALRAGFFHPFEAETKVYGKGLFERVMCVEHVEPAKDGTFVIGRAATVQTTSFLVSGQLERREIPTVRELGLQNDKR
jgi:hypothetical protein